MAARRVTTRLIEKARPLPGRALLPRASWSPQEISEWTLARVSDQAPFECAAVYAYSEDEERLQRLAVRGTGHEFPAWLQEDSAIVLRLSSGLDAAMAGEEDTVDRELNALGADAAICARSGAGLELLVLLKLANATSKRQLLGASAAIAPAAVAHEGTRLLASAGPGEAFLEEMLDSLTDAVIAIEGDGKIFLANRAANKMLGISREDLISRDVSALPAVLRDITTKCFESGCDIYDHQVTLGNNDAARPLTVSVRVFRSSSGKPAGGVVILNDATALEELRKRIRDQERLAWLGTLSASIAHELRNPLVSIRALAQLLPEKYDDPEFRNEFSALALSEVDRINIIADRLLNFARPSEPVVEAVDVNRLIEDTVGLLKPQMAEKNVRLGATYSATNATLLGDATQLKQVFLNIMLNSLQAVRENGSVTVKTLNSPGVSELAVEISDNGMGIPGDQVDKVFDPFFSTKRHGSGLGLTISQMIIRQHSGEMELASEEGKGTTFYIRLPLRSSHREQTAD